MIVLNIYGATGCVLVAAATPRVANDAGKRERYHYHRFKVIAIATRWITTTDRERFNDPRGRTSAGAKKGFLLSRGAGRRVYPEMVVASGRSIINYVRPDFIGCIQVSGQYRRKILVLRTLTATNGNDLDSLHYPSDAGGYYLRLPASGLHH
jgi:hypothetical protein